MTPRAQALRITVIVLGIVSGGCAGPAMGPQLFGIEPVTVELAPGKSQQFIAIGTGPDTVWFVGDADNGIVSTSGLYEAPFVLPADRSVILHADPGGRAAEITLLDVAPDPRDCLGWGQDYLPLLGDGLIVDEAPQVLVEVPPVYPPIAMEAGVDGTVDLDVLVCKNGLVYDIAHVAGTSIPMLGSAASEAVRKWRFKPARIKGFFSAAWTRVHVKFVLP